MDRRADGPAGPMAQPGRSREALRLATGLGLAAQLDLGLIEVGAKTLRSRGGSE